MNKWFTSGGNVKLEELHKKIKLCLNRHQLKKIMPIVAETTQLNIVRNSNIFTQYCTVKPVNNDHIMGCFSALWSSSRWPRATQMSSRTQKLLARVNWYIQSSLKHITEQITGNKVYYRGGRYRQVSLYLRNCRRPNIVHFVSASMCEYNSARQVLTFVNVCYAHASSNV